MHTAECALDCGAELGEGPVWDPQDGVLYWVSIKAQEIHRFDPATGRDDCWRTPSDVGSLALRSAGGMLVALRSGFFFFDPPDRFTPVSEPEAGFPDNRLNDGKTDRQGRFWAGSLHDSDESVPSGSLYRLDGDLTCRRMLDGIHASNGLAFSPDGRTAYFAEVMKSVSIWVVPNATQVGWDTGNSRTRSRRPAGS